MYTPFLTPLSLNPEPQLSHPGRVSDFKSHSIPPEIAEHILAQKESDSYARIPTFSLSRPQELREHFFTNIERVFMTGLRCPEPTQRAAFFALYDQRIQPTLFDRLHFVIVLHDWEAMAGQFWLKQALVGFGKEKDREAGSGIPCFSSVKAEAYVWS